VLLPVAALADCVAVYDDTALATSRSSFGACLLAEIFSPRLLDRLLTVFAQASTIRFADLAESAAQHDIRTALALQWHEFVMAILANEHCDGGSSVYVGNPGP